MADERWSVEIARSGESAQGYERSTSELKIYLDAEQAKAVRAAVLGALVTQTLPAEYGGPRRFDSHGNPVPDATSGTGKKP